MGTKDGHSLRLRKNHFMGITHSKVKALSFHPGPIADPLQMKVDLKALGQPSKGLPKKGLRGPQEGPVEGRSL
jgi:hypothetical protein